MTISFPKASDINKNFQSYDLVVFDEVYAIERQVLVAAANNQLETIVSGTTMTGTDQIGEDYYKVSEGLLENRMYKQQLQTVENYFKDKKYAISKISSGKFSLTNAAVNNPGYNYAPGDVVTLVTDNSYTTTPAQVTVDSVQAISLAISVAGTGYSVNDTITVSNGTADSPITAIISSVDVNGAVTGITLLNAGQYTVIPLLGAQTTTLGFGTGLVLQPTWGIKTISLLENGLFSSSPTSPLTSTSTNGNSATFNIIVGVNSTATFQWKIQW